MSTFILKLLTLVLVLTVALSSCDVLASVLGQPGDDTPAIEDSTENETPDVGEEPDDEGNNEADDPEKPGTEDIPHAHSYTAVVTAPTCSSEGYTAYTCECGDSYTSDKVGKLEHSYNDGVSTVCGSADPDYAPVTGGEFNYADVPEYTDSNYVAINGNVPYFTKDEITSSFFERYSDLDSLGWCKSTSRQRTRYNKRVAYTEESNNYCLGRCCGRFRFRR